MDEIGHQFDKERRPAAQARIKAVEFPLVPPSAAPSYSMESLPSAFGHDSEPEKRIRELEEEIEQLRSSPAAQATGEREAYELGRNDGLAEANRVRQRVLEGMARQLDQAISGFRAGEESFLHAVEQEVVRLSLAIAVRILRREAQLDPLLLAGAVRAALGQLSETAEVRLRIPERELSLWQEMVRLTPNLSLRPQLIPDATMTTGECILESSMGVLDLGVNSQLNEIEKGFFEQSSGENAVESVAQAERAAEHRRRRRPEESPADAAAAKIEPLEAAPAAARRRRQEPESEVAEMIASSDVADSVPGELP